MIWMENGNRKIETHITFLGDPTDNPNLQLQS